MRNNMYLFKKAYIPIKVKEKEKWKKWILRLVNDYKMQRLQKGKK